MNGKVTYRQQYTRCGKQRCRKCKEGEGHGPYWYAYWSENGRTISKYIGIHPPAEVEAQQILLTPKKECAKPKRSIEDSSLRVPSSQLKMDTPTRGEEENTIQDKFLNKKIDTQPILRIYLLGQFRVERHEGDTWQTIANRTWQRRRARALLGCLLSQAGRRMGREQVMEALWPDLDIETAANRLNGAVHELRQILEPEIARPAASKMLRLERDILILADASSIWVDAEAFETLLNRANTTKDPLELEQILERAATLYEGDYLLEELYSEWTAARRESLRRGWMGLLLELARLRAAHGTLTSAIEPLDRLLTADPTHETAVRRLMILLTQLDRRGEAIRVYQRLADTLKREYESEPLPETTELYKDLRQGNHPRTDVYSETASEHVHSRMARITEPLPQEQEKASIPPATPAEPDTPSSTLPLLHPVLPLGRHNQSPLIGREHELETMRQMMLAIDRISPQATAEANKKAGPPERRTRKAHVAIVMGETGIGKTRLAEEISHEALARGWRVAWTRAYEQEGTIPYRPWTDILRTLLQDMPLEQITNLMAGKANSKVSETSGGLSPAATAQAKLARLGSLLPELATQQTPVPPPNHLTTSAAPEQERLHLWEAMLSLLSALCQSTPLLLVLDDLHWTDDSSLELLAYLARHQPNERIMWIGTCRDMELAPSASLRALLNDLRREQVLVTLPLRPLTANQIGRMIAHLPHDVVRSIQSQAGGNPLFAEELARFSEITFSENQEESDKNSGYYPGSIDETNTPTSTGLPETIAAVLERRLNKLSPECQALLSRAAVLGGSFEFGLLLLMTGETGPGEDISLDLLEEALRSGLLTEEVSGTRIVYHFWHPLIVSHLYEHLSAVRRAQLHRRAAQALIELYADNNTEVAAAIAYHLGKHGHEKQKFAYYAEIAGNKAYTVSAYPEALHYYCQALEALQAFNAPSQGDRQAAFHLANLLERAAECNKMQGYYLEARQQYVRVLELHSSALQIEPGNFASQEEFETWRHEEIQVQGLLWRAIGNTWRNTSDYRQAHECAEKGRQVLRAAGVTTGAAWACLQYLDGSIYWAEGSFDEARRLIQESLEIHQEVIQFQQKQPRGQVAREKLPVPLLAHSRRALLGDPLELGRTREALGVIAASLGQHSEALQHLYAGLAIYEKHDLVGAMGQVCGNIGAVHSMRAEYEIASTYFKRALALTERTGDIPSRTLVTGNLGDVAARAGNLQEAVTWLNSSLALADQISDRDHTSWCLAALAAAQQDLGNARGALESIRRALAVGRSMESGIRVGFALVTLANWRATRAMMRSNLEAASLAPVAKLTPADQRLLYSALAAATHALNLEGIDAETQSIGQTVLAHIYYLLGDLERAQQQALQVLAETRQNEMMLPLGRAQRLLGEIQAARGLEAEADSYFEQALQTFKQYGLRLDYARTLHRYGCSLLRRTEPTMGDATYQQGFDYLYEARTIFETCQASLDLQWVEHILASLPRPYVSS
ncbi:MAG TPA: DUF6788 family protein [Ktedonobacteraceae bacterium]|nr:DUF6788 family protein [Ktedonobacteraceae bacterium]